MSLNASAYAHHHVRTHSHGQAGRSAGATLVLLRVVARPLFARHDATTLFGKHPDSTHPDEGPVALATLRGLFGVREAFGGILVMLGLVTRPVAFLLAGAMALICFHARAGAAFRPEATRGALPVLYGLVLLWPVAHGAGGFRLDRRRISRHRRVPGAISTWLAAALLIGAAPAALQGQQAALPGDSARWFPAYRGVSGPGCAMLAVRNGQVLFRRAYGLADIAHRAPITTRTVFGVASVTKQFTAALVASLVRDGRVGLGDEIQHYIPELPRYGEPLLIKDLLHHVSGLRDYLSMMGVAGRDAEGVLSADEALTLLARQRGLNFAPGTAHLYSNSNYFLLGLLVERVTGSSLAEAARDRLFRPLGMEHTFFLEWSGRIVPGLATSYREDGNDTLLAVPLRGELRGDGGLYSTVEDLVRWDAFLSGRLTPTGLEGIAAQLVARGTLRDGTGVNYAGGLAHDWYRGRATVSHGGTWGGYRSFMLRIPELGFASMALCNQLELRPTRMAFELADTLLTGDLIGPAVTMAPPAAPPVAAPSPFRLAGTGVAGNYYSSELQVFHRIADSPEGWTVQIADGEPAPATVTSPHGLRVGSWNYTFAVGPDSAVTGFRLDGNRVRGVEFERRDGQAGPAADSTLEFRRGGTVVIDGEEGVGEWSDAEAITIQAAGGPVRVRFKHDGSRLLFAFTGLTMSPLRVAEVLLDVDGKGGETWSPDDLWVHVSYSNCFVRGIYGAYDRCEESRTLIRATNFQGNDRAPAILEVSVPIALVQFPAGLPARFRVAFVVTDTRRAWELSPAHASHLRPASWAPARIRP